MQPATTKNDFHNICIARKRAKYRSLFLGEIILAKPLEELTKITHVGAPIVLKIVAEEIRTMRDEPPAQATVVELGLLLGEPGNSPPYFENDKLVVGFLIKIIEQKKKLGIYEKKFLL